MSTMIRISCAVILDWPRRERVALAQPDVASHFAGLNGTFVLLDGTTGEKHVRHNPPAHQRFSPCSTFKIPHTAILPESGAAGI